jgi:hypothetical protein
VHTITSVQEALSHEQDARARRYLISMGIRTICVILTIVVPSPWRWFFAVGAVFLPYVAVVVANQRHRIAGVDLELPGLSALPGPSSAAAGADPASTPATSDAIRAEPLEADGGEMRADQVG